jgi:hemoglobin/transferrin/lactoferrin receptor protein
MTTIGQVALGPFGPAAVVYPSPILLGPPSVAHPVRVPNATFRDIGLFVQDEWDVSRNVRLTGGLRVDGYRVRTKSTPGYEIASLVAGATPAIDPATLPAITGDRISRTAVTGEAGVVVWSGRPFSLFGHYVRSYRHPNLEELLFAGPATAGSIVPNVTVEPETGHNVDVGARFRADTLTGSIAYFNNTYDNFISTEIVATKGSGSSLESISQAINLARVRIQGVEVEANAPFAAGPVNWLPYGTVSYNHGTVLEGTSPFSGLSLDQEPQDNITPWKVTAGLRVSDQAERWWAGYNVRSVGRVSRISPLLDESPFLIAQDLLSLDGFAVHRVAVGYDWRRGGQWLGLVGAVDNLADRFYREQFQFAPARGRSFTLTLSVRGAQ